MNTILIVDDESGFRENVAERLQSRGYEVHQAGDGEAALKIARERAVHVALVDVLMPGMDGITLLGFLKDLDPMIEGVVLTGQGTIESAVEAMRKGAFHYLTKPIRLAELEMVVKRAVEKGGLARQNQMYREGIRRRDEPKLIAEAPAMRKLVEEARGIAATDSSVLIEGETGTGKEVFAEFLHRNSPRRERNLVVVNCGALTDSLLDAELFGHEKGAFTGASEARPGLVEVADGGTLFLDEIGDMEPAAQVRLLRVLERGRFRRVGSTRELSTDVRVIAATHRDLVQAMQEGKFREDLYHRLMVFRLRIPPLRERPEDLLPLAERFLPKGKRLSPAALGAMRAHPWPGNVRELAHAVQRAAFASTMAGTDEVRAEHLGFVSTAPTAEILVSLDEAQRRHVLAVLERVGGNRTQAAKVLGISERHLYRLLQRESHESIGKDRGTDGEVMPE